jgi:hypothetical protein
MRQDRAGQRNKQLGKEFQLVKRAKFSSQRLVAYARKKKKMISRMLSLKLQTFGGS